jgi:hypothetical protein
MQISQEERRLTRKRDICPVISYPIERERGGEGEEEGHTYSARHQRKEGLPSRLIHLAQRRERAGTDIDHQAQRRGRHTKNDRELVERVAGNHQVRGETKRHRGDWSLGGRREGGRDWFRTRTVLSTQCLNRKGRVLPIFFAR